MADVRAPAERIEDLVEGASQLRQITVVEGTCIELLGQFIEHAYPLRVPRTCQRRGRHHDQDLDAPLNHLDSGPT